ncbi:MAG: DUF2511 domain-containing protein, partial [Alterinioella nitratireducens]
HVECRNGMEVVFVSGGETYALNGTAQSRGHQRIDPIWLDNPELPGLKISVSPMIDMGLDLC